MIDYLYKAFIINVSQYCKVVVSFFYFIICFFVVTTCAQAQSLFRGLPLITNFTTEKYKGGIQNWDITQGTYDLLFVANNFGLLVYDGEKWEAIPVNEATRILSVAYGVDQFIYIGGQGDFGFFSATNSGKLEYTSLKEKLPDIYQNFNEVWKILVLDNATYFCTFSYLFKYENGELEVIDPQGSIGFSFKVRNQLFTQVMGKGLMHLEGNQFDNMKHGDELNDKDLRGMVPFDKNHTLIATRNNGLYLLGNDGLKPFEIPINKQLKEAQITTIKLLSNNFYAIGTQNQGLLIIDKEGDIVHALTEARGLINNTVLSLYEDRFGNLWTGLNNGIAFIELGQPFTMINDNMELPGTGYTAFYSGDQLLLGTNNGLFSLPSSTNSFYPTFQPIEGTKGQTYSLQLVHDKLLLGHFKGGFEVINTQSKKLEGLRQGIWKFEEIPDSNDRVIAGSYKGIYLLEKKSNNWQVIKKYKNFEESSRRFHFANDSTIWMSHGYKGVYKLSFTDSFESLEKVRFYDSEDGFPSNLLINVFKIENRLVFTAAQGVYKFNPIKDRFIPDTTLNTYFGEQRIRELEEDILGNLYFITDEEMGVLKKNTIGTYEKETALFKKVVNYVSDDLEDITVIDSENVLINAKEGFIHYDPSYTFSEPEAFTTVFRNITWGDSTIFSGYYLQEVSNEMTDSGLPFTTLPFSRNSLHFHYASTYFEGNISAQYQYWLEDFDSGWSNWTLLAEKEYTNLPAGEYIFRVRSRNSRGAISKIMEYPFIISPPWYQTIYAYLIYTSLGLFVFGLAIYSLDVHYKKRNRNLQESTSKALKAKESKLQRVTEQSEKEIAKLKNERLEAELKHKNQELASSAMHLITKNEFMNFLKLEISHLIKEDDTNTINKGLRRIGKTIEKNIAEDELWDQFEMHFDQVHGDFIKKLRGKYPSLTPQEVKLSAFLRMNMSSKEIAHLLTISVRGVEISRYRLRKKLPIESHENLVDFMMKIN
ncbi:MAG: triple tyrosine motif-containing protein [Bacteroidota bacterium]